MTICCVMGNDPIYDKELHNTIKSVLRSVLSQDSDFTFYFFPSYFLRPRSFPHLFYQTIEQIKKDFPTKMIHIVFLDTHPRASLDPLICKGDVKFFYPPVVSENVHFAFNSVRVQKWMLEQSAYLFSYLYFDIDCVDQNILKCINRQLTAGKLKLVDLTAASTHLIIKEQAELLPARQKYVYEELGTGHREPVLTEELAKELGVSRKRIYSIYRESCRNLRSMVYASKRHTKL